MAQPTNTTVSVSNYQQIFDSALEAYRRRTKQDLLSHPLFAKLETCKSPDAILVMLLEQIPGFDQSGSNDNIDNRLSKWLKPTVNVIYALSGIIGAGIALAYPPAGIIFTGMGVLLSVARASTKDAVLDLFERFQNFFRRLEIYIEVTPTAGMTDVIVKILAEFLFIIAIATKESKQSRAKTFLNKLAGRTDIEDAMQRLDHLTQEEARMAAAQGLKAAHAISNDVKDLGDRLNVAIYDGEKMRGDMHQMGNDVIEQKRNQLNQDIRTWLSPPDPSVNYNTACDARHEGTAMWFIESDTFKDWKASGSLLWVHGKPGSGKSVLAATIVQEIVAIPDENARVAYFFFDFKDKEKQDARSLISSLLVQLCDRSNSFDDVIFQFYSTHHRGSQQPSDSSITKCLEDMLKVPDQPPIYLIFDALDECPNMTGMPSSRDKVLALVERLLGLKLQNLRLCVTSRPEIDIRTSLEFLTCVHLSIHDQEGQKKDIVDFVRAVVYSDKNMRRWRDEDKELVIQTLSDRADGMFRWAFCQLEILRHCLPPSVQHVLAELPETLDETYERILQEIPKSNWVHAHRLLQCLAVAIRPLAVEELAEVLAVDFNTEGAIPKLNVDLRWEDQEQAVLSACSSLVTVVNIYGSRMVQFSHFSVKEFLTSDRLATSKVEISRSHYIHLDLSHAIMAQACLSVLLRLDQYTDENSIKNYPLASYAAAHFGNHAESGTVLSQIMSGIDYLFDEDKPHFASWLWARRGSYFGERHPQRPEAPPLYYLAEFGYHRFLKHLISKRPNDVNARGEHGMPLHTALRMGHSDISQLLLVHCNDVDAQNPYGQTPLHLAVYSGLLDVIRIVIKRNADINARDNHGLTPLCEAMRWVTGIYGLGDIHLDVATLLLEHGADVDALDPIYSTLLHMALSERSIRAVELLLDHGPNVNTQNITGQTPLHLAVEWNRHETILMRLSPNCEADLPGNSHSTPLLVPRASYSGSLEVTYRLLEHGANVHFQNNEGKTPLQALFEHHKPDFRLVLALLEYGADMDTQRKDQSTLLHLASSMGDPEAVQLLIRHGANVSVQDNEGQTPLHLALGNMRHGELDSFCDVIRLLLDQGADVDALDNDHSTPLHLASRYGNPEGARLLLEQGANVNVRSKCKTPILEAGFQFWCDYVTLIRVLLTHGADVNVQDDNHSTPLHLTSRRGVTEVADLLLEHGASVHARDNDGRTPLHCASQHRHLDIMQLLLERGADVDARDHTHSTSLHLASCEGNYEAVEVLLEHGANVHVRDNMGGTPLHDASWGGHLRIMRLLLKNGADVDAQSNNAMTALHLASYQGDVDIIALLLEHGADIHRKDSKDQTPYRIALARGESEILRMLSERRQSD